MTAADRQVRCGRGRIFSGLYSHHSGPQRIFFNMSLTGGLNVGTLLKSALLSAVVWSAGDLASFAPDVVRGSEYAETQTQQATKH